MRVRPLLVSPKPALAAGLTAALAAVLAGCGSGAQTPPPEPPPTSQPPSGAGSALAELAARTAAAQDLTTVSLYSLTPPGGAERTVMVIRAADGGWRVDVAGGGLGGAVDIAIVANREGLFQCALPSTGRPEAGCVPVERLTADIDPRVQHVFTDWLDVLSDRAAPLAVSAVEPLPDATGMCFSVQPRSVSLEAPVDTGVYCYEADGTLTGAELGLGELRLVSTGDTAPPSVDLPGPVTADADPLPTAAPPSPTPEPSPSPA